MRELTSLQKVLFLGVIVMLTTGCVAVTPPVDTIFRSNDYIVYRLKSDETPQMLAQRFLGDQRKAWLIEEANQGKPFHPDQLVVIPLRPRNKGRITEEGFQVVPILCYHQFGGDSQSPLCVPAAVFDRQMNYLKKHGYHAITAEDMLAYLEYRRQLPRKAFMITIDDGYRSVYTVAVPILKKYGFPATLFVYTNYIGVSSKAITWNQLRELKAEGFTIGSHTIAHSDLSTMADNENETTYRERLRHEIFDSKKIIDTMLKQDTFFFAYPFGRANETAATLARQAGYRLAVTVRRGGNPFFANPYLLQRDQILKHDMATFAKRLETFYALPLR
jgi:peptidoglycan/xylan/chitin deacetylase (PgdA/CDA1 family)